MKPAERMKIPRQPMPEQDAQERARNFQEVNTGLAVEAAKIEAERCLRCKKAKCIHQVKFITDFINLRYERLVESLPNRRSMKQNSTRFTVAADLGLSGNANAKVLSHVLKNVIGTT